MSQKKRIQRDYDPAFREQAARLVLVEKLHPNVVAKDLGIPVNSLYTWVSKFRNKVWPLDGSVASSGATETPQPRPASKLPSSSQKQHDRVRQLEVSHRELEAKLRRMTQERDILKKAMAYCLEAPK